MNEHKINLGKTFVYADDISITATNVVSRFIWFGHVFNLILDEVPFIPANQDGWKWILDGKLTDHSSVLRLHKSEDTHSYIAIHYNSNDEAPVPVNYGLNVPEFIGNYLGLIIEDEGCRVKKLLHPLRQPLEIGKYVVYFKDLKNRQVTCEIHN